MANWREEHLIDEHLTILTEGSTRPDIGLTAVAAHWGLKLLQPEEIRASTGFQVLYQSDYGHTSLDRRRTEAVIVAADTIRQAIFAQGWQSNDVQHLHIGSSNIWDPDFLSDVVDASRLSHLPPDSIEVTAMACNSGVRALQKALQSKASGPTLVATIDDMTGRVEVPEAADALSWGIFSNGVAALAFEGGRGLTHIAGNDLVVLPDTNGALAVRVAYPQERPGDFTGRLVQDKNLEYVVMPRPKSSQRLIEMNGPATARLFVGLVAKYAPQFLDTVDLKEIPHWVAHQPSRGPFSLIDRRFPNLGLTWVSPEGNSSGTTAMVALVKQMESFEPGRRVGFLGFGAGASLSIEVAQLGAV